MVLVKKLERNTIKSVTNSHWGLTFYCNTLLAWAREVFSILNENSFGKMKNNMIGFLAIEHQCSQEIKLLFMVSSCVLIYLLIVSATLRVSVSEENLAISEGTSWTFPDFNSEKQTWLFGFLESHFFQESVLLVYCIILLDINILLDTYYLIFSCFI